MKIEKLFKHDVIVGIVLGALLGLYIPMEAHKPLLMLVALVMGLKLVTAK